MSRPITFPKTAEGEWTNRESGVRIVKTSGSVNSHEVRLASANIVGWSHAGYASSLPKARVLAKQVAERVREQIATAYVEAVSEHIDRSEAEAKKVDAPTWRLNAARRSIVSERFQSALYDVQRAGALIEIYRKRQAEADEARRTEQMDRFCEQYGYKGARTPSAIARLVEFAHASALTGNFYINDLATAYEQGVDATIEVVNASTDWVGSAVRAELQRREEKRERDYDHAAEVIAEARVTEGTVPQRGPLYPHPSGALDLPVLDPSRFQVAATGKAGGGKAGTERDMTNEIHMRAAAFAASVSDLADIPDEALAMNAGFDLAAAQPITPAYVHGADFISNVQRYQH